MKKYSIIMVTNNDNEFLYDSIYDTDSLIIAQKICEKIDIKYHKKNFYVESFIFENY